MIRVYKTDVDSQKDAKAIADLIHCKIPACTISFDLEDCDNVLRIENDNGAIDEGIIRGIFRMKDHYIEALPL